MFYFYANMSFKAKYVTAIRKSVATMTTTTAKKSIAIIKNKIRKMYLL